MSAENKSPRSLNLQEYLEAWGTSIGRVIQEVASAPHSWQELTPDATQALLASLKDNSVSIQFEAADHLSGNQGFVLSTKDVVRLSQLLLTEPEDGSSAITTAHRDAIGELFRQFAECPPSLHKGWRTNEAISHRFPAQDKLATPVGGNLTGRRCLAHCAGLVSAKQNVHRMDCLHASTMLDLHLACCALSNHSLWCAVTNS